MKIIKVKDYESMSIAASAIIYGELMKPRRVNVALTAGKSPVRIYEILKEQLSNQSLDHVHFYNFDEGSINGGEPNFTISELKTRIYEPWGIDESKIEALTVDAYKSYDKKIKADGGLDLIVMGLGADGHFCANMPGTNVLGDLDMRMVSGDANGVHAEFVTMGARSVMMAQNLLMIVSGVEKAKALQEMIEGPISDLCPASVLTLHPNLIIIADEAACSLLESTVI